MSQDRAYKLLFSHPEMVADLLRGFVLEDWVAQLDFSTLKKCNGSYVSDQLRKREDDIVWRVRFRDEWLYVYLLLEFQSSADPWMALRMLVYLGLLYQDLVRAKQLTRDGHLPPVLPLVLYNGVPAWNAPLELEALLAPAPSGLECYRPQMRYLLLDEGRIELAQDDKLRNLAAEIFRLEQCSTAADMAPVVRALNAWLNGSEQESLRRAITEWLEQVLLPGRLPGVELPSMQNLQEVETMLAEKVKEWTEEWKRQGIQEGMQEGIREGKQQGLREGLREGQKKGESKGIQIGESRLLARLLMLRFGELPAWAEAKLAAAAPEQLENWGERVLSARTLEETLAD